MAGSLGSLDLETPAMGAHPWGLSLLPLDVFCLLKKKKQTWKLRHMALAFLSHCC